MYPTIKELDNHIYFVHRTPIFPLNGIMIPGEIVRKENADDQRQSLQEHQERLKTRINRRMTIHWFPNALVESHGGNPFSSQYVIIEHARWLRPYLYGGYAEDFWSIGYYQLSSEAIILVPATEISSLRNKAGLAQLIPYSNSEMLPSLLADILSKKTTWKLEIDQRQIVIEPRKAQWYIDLYSTDEKPIDDLAEENLKAARSALSQRQVTFQFRSWRPIEELELIYQGKKCNAKQFFSAWHEEGKMYFGGHDGSLFKKLENKISFLNNYLLNLEKYVGRDIEFFNETWVKPLSSHLKGLEQLIEDLKKSISENKFLSPRVLDYFTDEWEANFMVYWLNLFKSLEGKKFSAVAQLKPLYYSLKDQMLELAQAIGLGAVSYQPKIIPNHGVTQILSQKLNRVFLARQRLHGYYVDAIWIISEGTNINNIQLFLLCNKIFTYSERIETKNVLIVPKVNTRLVADAIIALP